MKYFSKLVVLTAAALLLFSCHRADQALQLEWRGGWVRALPPGSSMTAAYGELWNHGQEIIILNAFDSSGFASVSMHQSIMEDGVSRMQQQVNVQIEAGEMLQLQPGGMHLMLMGAEGKAIVGDEIEIAITSGGQRFLFNLPVKAR